MADALSLRAYAAHRKRHGLTGGSLQAVQRAVQSERLKESLVTVDGLLRIADLDLADREWAENTDQTRQPTTDHGGDESAEDEQAQGFAYWKAKKMELDYLRAAAKVVDADDMTAAIATALSILRTQLLGLPSKVKQRNPDVTLAILATIDEAVREQLTEAAAALAALGPAA